MVEYPKIEPTPNAIILNHFGAYMDSPLSKRNFIPSQINKIRELTKINKIIRDTTNVLVTI